MTGEGRGTRQRGQGTGTHAPYTAMDNTATKLALIAMKANENRRLRFTSLTHHLNVDYLTACFRELAYRKAPGIDGRTVESYMDDEIRVALLQITKAIKGKRYRPQPVKRVYIEKQGSTKRRPLGLPVFLDKVVQQACKNILEAIYEPV